VPGAGDRSPAPAFGARLAAAVAARESQIVLGIDPDPARLWPDPREDIGLQRERLAVALVGTADAANAASPAPAAAEAAAAVLVHCRALIDGAGPACVAVKPQLACFERLGSAGWLALEATCAHAREAGLLVLADGKRGDVPVTAIAYAQGLVGSTPSPFGAVPGLDVDALTANPMLGRDALTPLVEGARAAGAGVFILVRTSNPGAADVMDLRLAGGEPLWEHLARLAHELGGGAPDGLADVGAVTGATVPEHLARMRERVSRTPFLLPGVGAQGGDVRALAPAFAPGRAGGLVTASRSIVGAHEHHGGEPAQAARHEAERLRALAWSLG
jgi:orotidine-5'-phosphate decarboxylase